MYKIKNYESLLGLDGFSDNLLKNHFKLYEGYVTNVNKIEEFLENKRSGSVEYSEVQRRFAWEWNGMRLHELYFGNLSKEKIELEDRGLKDKISEIFGSFEEWKKSFINIGKMRGIGWVVLVYDKESGELDNLWIDEHSNGHFVGTVPLLVMDVFEHAFITDYGLNRADYIDSFFKVIDWGIISERFSK